MFSEVFFLTLMSASFAFLALSVRQCFKCRISEISMCGLVIKRDTQLENEEAEMRIEHNVPDTARISSIGNNNPLSPIVPPITRGENKV